MKCTSIFRRETQELWREGAIPLIFFISVCLISFAAVLGKSAAEQQRNANDNLAAQDQKRYSKLIKRLESIHPEAEPAALLYSAAHPMRPLTDAAQHAVKPPTPFSFLSSGHDDRFPAYLRVRYDAMDLINNRESFDNPELGMDGQLDLVFVIVFLVPLLVIVMGFNLMSQERELGTWRMSFAQPVTFPYLVAVKFFTRLAWLSLAILVPLTGAMVWACTSWAGIDVWLTALAVVTGVFLYLTFWLGLLTLINLGPGSSAANATAAITLWIVITLAVPALWNLGGRIAIPQPSHAALISASQKEWDHTFSHARSVLARKRQEPGNQPGSDAFFLDVPGDWSYLAVFHRDYEKRMADRYQARDDAEQGLAAWQNAGAWLTPAAAVNRLLETVAGADYMRHRSFMAQADDYHRRFNAFFLPVIYRAQRLQAEEYARMPRTFTWREPGLQQRIKTPLQMLSALVLANTGVALIFRHRLKRGRHATGN